MICVLLLLLAFGPSDGWVSLFDGKSLAGWRVESVAADRGKNFWRVEDGVIVCDSLGRPDHNYVWLITEQEFGDFELRLEVRGFAGSPGNSGVQVRSRFDRQSGWLDGPQVDIHPPQPWRTGLIYDETRGTRRWVFPSLPDWKIDESHAPAGWRWHEGGWNSVRILCEDLRIRTWTNGVPVADFDGAGVLDDADHRARSVGLRGHIALQLHSKDELKIQFRDIKLRRLD